MKKKLLRSIQTGLLSLFLNLTLQIKSGLVPKIETWKKWGLLWNERKWKNFIRMGRWLSMSRLFSVSSSSSSRLRWTSRWSSWSRRWRSCWPPRRRNRCRWKRTTILVQKLSGASKLSRIKKSSMYSTSESNVAAMQLVGSCLTKNRVEQFCCFGH